MKISNVTRYTRAGRDGKYIFCPVCQNAKKVYHFSWGATICLPCRDNGTSFNGKDAGEIDKSEWLVRS